MARKTRKAKKSLKVILALVAICVLVFIFVITFKNKPAIDGHMGGFNKVLVIGQDTYGN